jgi:hypothetical protein
MSVPERARDSLPTGNGDAAHAAEEVDLAAELTELGQYVEQIGAFALEWDADDVGAGDGAPT